MPKTMKAAVLRAIGAPLAIEQVPIPTPGPGEFALKGFDGRRPVYGHEPTAAGN